MLPSTVTSPDLRPRLSERPTANKTLGPGITMSAYAATANPIRCVGETAGSIGPSSYR
ncbi:hypothetical protein [Mycobacteroides abscessus]|uniref:hypothetical protein n=1 Tax=Mycobacteroides abscessus TaxID=36809 RepID=UPI0002686A95|nr:hypothetical protein [Mycobacteroides abscessus]EIV65042.1 hypothetical protein MMCCUG48898_3959 [Mycobacteroides abscessus subsp. massiliense CCUG 48898 = JCM 15300]